MYIRIKKRKSSNGIKKYAYLVRSKCYKKGPRQKIARYLGKVYEIKKQKHIKTRLNQKIQKDLEPFLAYLVTRELKRQGFKQKTNLIFHHPQGFFVDIFKKKVYNKENNQIALSVNYGVLCDYTLKKLFERSYLIEKPIVIAKDLGKKLISAGISVKNEEFIQIYDLISKKTMPNNAKQYQAMPGNARQR